MEQNFFNTKILNISRPSLFRLSFNARKPIPYNQSLNDSTPPPQTSTSNSQPAEAAEREGGFDIKTSVKTNVEQLFLSRFNVQRSMFNVRFQTSRTRTQSSNCPPHLRARSALSPLRSGYLRAEGAISAAPGCYLSNSNSQLELIPNPVYPVHPVKFFPFTLKPSDPSASSCLKTAPCLTAPSFPSFPSVQNPPCRTAPCPTASVFIRVHPWFNFPCLSAALLIRVSTHRKYVQH
jgi:hypothetical protein